ncbi:hypothetical protein O181_015841 [Austropuccinia psidii MF-1]|uniref:Transposase domain-containing protein n=1 Tax=Austropuccinia psidii MF-1 TaxID=1389203 RepID=A0A9Q3GQH3_9BASI|nr:hypothetical protein [Austropuccinia psidii MF-1]
MSEWGPGSFTPGQQATSKIGYINIMEFCTCPSCKNYQVTTSDGTIRNGLYVDRSTRIRHWKKVAQKEASFITPGISKFSLSKEEQISTHLSSNDEDIHSDPDEIAPSSNFNINSKIINLILYFTTWLYLACGLSRENCRRARDIIVYMIELVSQEKQPNKNQLSTIPRDIRTISKCLKLKFSFERRYVCCPRCYSLYDIEVAPEECTYKPTLSSNQCYEELFKPHKMHPFPRIQFVRRHLPRRRLPRKYGQIQLHGQSRLRNPKATFILQSILSWVTWLLNVPGVEERIEEWEHRLSCCQGTVFFDVAQANIWKEIFPQTSSPHHLQLGFGLFVDWFNPRGNKISGQQTSMGILVLYCLNLQPRERFQPKYTCLAGVIPSPNQPDMITINNILKPLVDELMELNREIVIKTPNYPHGRRVIIRLVGLIGDIIATHKVGGFMSHSAKHFCSWCEVEENERVELMLGKARKKREVLGASHRWKDARTVKLQQKFAKENGIRWSELNRLPYWDPVSNISLGIVHNWYEGVLQHHLRYRWGFDQRFIQQICSSEASSLGSDEEMVDNFASENEDELQLRGFLSEEIIEKIRSRLNEVIVPKGVSRIPSKIGTAQTGKLKANEWSVLFSIYLPLIVLDLLWDLGPSNHLLLVNFSALIKCTEIVGARSITQQDANLFEEAFATYQNSSKNLFPNIRVVPNHHYSMHIPEQLMRWGPMNGISEYGGERLIGLLQKIKTNSLSGDVEETIMQKFGQLQRLQQIEPDIGVVLSKKSKSSINKMLLDDYSYLNLFNHLKKVIPQLRQYSELPHPRNSIVLRKSVFELNYVTWRFGLKVSKRSPNNLIYLTKGKGKVEFGEVVHILDLGDDQIQKGPLLMVGWLEAVTEREETFEGVDTFLDSWSVKQLSSRGKYGYVSLSEISGLGAYLKMPAWTLGYKNPSTMAHPINKLVGLEHFD